LLIVDGGFRIEALLRTHAAQGWVGGRLQEVGGVGMRPRVIADEMQMLAGRGGDTERLFHQAIRLIPVPVRPIIEPLSPIVVAAAC
jgi:hypothetical protein